MGGKDPWRWECLDAGEVSIQRDFNIDGLNKFLGMASEEWVVAKIIAGAIGDSKCESLQPGSATLWVCGNDNVVVASLESHLEKLNPVNKLPSKPEVLVEK